MTLIAKQLDRDQGGQNSRALLEELGFAIVGEDALAYSVTLPDGWTMIAEHLYPTICYDRWNLTVAVLEGDGKKIFSYIKRGEPRRSWLNLIEY